MEQNAKKALSIADRAYVLETGNIVLSGDAKEMMNNDRSRKHILENRGDAAMKKTVITIARSYGSGGRTLGKLLAEELGINCYDRDFKNGIR